MNQSEAVCQSTLFTKRRVLVPLGDERLDLEVELDPDPEVIGYSTGRGLDRGEGAPRQAAPGPFAGPSP
jgi:hypothetical protein